MRFGVREICNVVLRAKATQTLGSRKFYKNEPVLYFDSLKTSSVEGASTTVYATGGRGNTRLVAWEGERTLTFTMEDALISPESFSILSGAGLIAATDNAPIYVHSYQQVQVKDLDTIVLNDLACWNKYADDSAEAEKGYKKDGADIFIMAMKDGEICAEPCTPANEAGSVVLDFDNKTTTIKCYSHAGHIEPDDVVLVDFYVKRTGGAQTIEITADKFGGNYYLEASTLFRRESDGVDMPAEFIIPNCKVQSNFTFSMASSGDPSTFTFTMDAFPDYTKFDKTHKVLAAIQVIEDQYNNEEEFREPCSQLETSFVPTAGDKLAITYDNDSTEKDVKITVSGAGIVGNGDAASYDKPTFNANNELDKVNATELRIDFADINSEKNYRVVQSNPALAFYPDDINIKNGVKNKTYSGADLAGGYSVLLSERRGPITVKLFDDKGVLVQSVKVTNNVSFVPIEE